MRASSCGEWTGAKPLPKHRRRSSCFSQRLRGVTNEAVAFVKFLLPDPVPMRTLVLFIVMLGSINGRCVAETLPQPVDQFVGGLFESPEILPDFRERWNAIAWEFVSMERRDPNGGYLFRFSFAFNSSEDTFVFVATDRFGDVGRNAPAWTIYQKLPSSQWRKIAENVVLNQHSFWIHHASRTIIQTIPDRFDDGTTYITLQVSIDGSIKTDSYRSENLSAQLREKFEKHSIPFAPTVQKIPLGALLSSPNVLWRPLDSSHSMAAQSLDPSDASILDSVGKIEWAEALQLYEKLVNQASLQDTQDQKAEFVQRSSSSPRHEPPIFSREPTGQQRNPSIEWWGIGVMAAGIVGLLWVLMKARKR
jgi:hypothetical protein